MEKMLSLNQASSNIHRQTSITGPLQPSKQSMAHNMKQTASPRN